MHFQFPLFVLAYLLAGIIALILAGAVWFRKIPSGGMSFCLLLVCLAIWSLASIPEAGALTVEAKTYWSKISYIGIVNMPVLWFVFASEYTRKGRWASGKYLFLLWIIPLFTLLLVFTNEVHQLIWTRVYIPPDGLNIAVYERGSWFWVNIFYSYWLMLFGSFMIGETYVRTQSTQKRQAVIFLGGLMFPWVLSILYMLRAIPITGFDPTPLGFIGTSMLVAWGFYTDHIFKIIPIARDMLVDAMSEALVVIDDESRVADLNSAAKQYLGKQVTNPIGIPIREVFPEFVAAIDRFCGEQSVVDEVQLTSGQFFEVRISPLFDHPKHQVGRLIIVSDISERKRVELAEREERQYAEALRDTAALINSSLNIDEVLDRILENVEKVVPHHAANIAFVDDQGVVSFVRGKGYRERDCEEALLAAHYIVDEVENLKKMAASGRASTMPDVQSDPKWVSVKTLDWIRSYAGAPIIARGKLLGFINLDAAEPDFFTQKHADRLQGFASQAAIAIENARLFEQTRDMAVTDYLTGVFNRRALLENVHREIGRAKRYHVPLSALMVDIDHFKKVNDTYGHGVGDQVLREVTETMSAGVRDSDIIGRFGGEEFVVLLPETRLPEAEKAAKRLCDAIDSLNIATKKGNVRVTISVGVTVWNAVMQSAEDLIDAADKAMYAAKSIGHNQVGVAQSIYQVQ